MQVLSAEPRTRVDQGRWRLDPQRSSVEFHVPNFYGLQTVTGRFGSSEGTLELGARPAAQLTIDAASLDTQHRRRDKHLRSAAFFDVERHPYVRFTSTSARVDGDSLKLRGQLTAAGRQIPLELDASVRVVDGELELEAVTSADQRELGMTFSPLWTVRTPAKLVVRGRLIPDDPR